MKYPATFEMLKASYKDCRLYCALIDGARDREIYDRLTQSQQRFSCLYDKIDHIPEEQRWAYPYITELRDEEFIQWLFASGWGDNWAVFLGTEVSFPLLRNQLANMIVAAGAENSKPYFFRYFDPSILRQLLPTCDDKQVRQFFKYTTYYWMEQEDGQPIYFYHQPFEPNALINYPISDAPFGKKLPLAL